MKAIKTCFGVSWARAAGMLYPKEKRLYEDPYSEKILTPIYKFWIFLMRSPRIFDAIMRSKEKSAPGSIGWMFCRFRYIDDILINSITKKEIETVVNLGAGMDCRAYYIPGIESIRYFEVDHPSVIKKKREKIKKILGKLPDHVIYVPIDLDKQSLEAELTKAGHDLNSKTLFIWEAISQYISKEANDSALKYVARAAPGSKIVHTYALKSFIEGKNIHDDLKAMHKYMCKKNNPLWIYGLDPAEIGDYLSKYSLSLIEDIGSEDLKERYKKLANLGLEVSEVVRIALAEVKR